MVDLEGVKFLVWSVLIAGCAFYAGGIVHAFLFAASQPAPSPFTEAPIASVTQVQCQHCHQYPQLSEVRWVDGLGPVCKRHETTQEAA